jgi:alkanesulfonate monooxygenase SsuD/methylene tetrahydromethanopterin reductase-like flavin-dependent oxidoreductase (luciferase family)
VHPSVHEGKYFRSRGPLSAPRSPQGRPVICQAGGSARGRTFAARWAETIIASAGSIESMKAFRNDIRSQAAGFGRNPDHIKVLFMISPIVDDFEASARARRQAQVDEANAHADYHLASFSRLTGIDFSKFDMDEVLPQLKSNGHQTIAAACSGKTPRQLLEAGKSLQDAKLVGTPDMVAREMSEIIDEVGGDGFLITYPELTRRYIQEIADGLTPALQKLGVVRKKYQHAMLRDHLLEF